MAVRLLTLLAGILLLNGCISIDLNTILNPPLREQVLMKKGAWSTGKLVLIDISGEIGSQGSMLTDASTNPSTIMEIIQAVERDPSVKGILLRINSPGGEVSATDTIFHELEALKKRRNLPVVSAITGLGCSGSYYLGVLGDTIYAQPSSVVGSIGVIARMPQLGGLADKIGYSEAIIKSGKMKDMGNPLKPLPDEVRAVIQGLINSHYDQFLSVVLANRKPLTDKAALKTIADGRVYSARQSLDNKLIDKIGYLTDAVEDLRIRAGLKNYRVVTYRFGGSPSAAIYSKLASPSPSLINLKSIGLQRRPGFFFIWQP